MSIKFFGQFLIESGEIDGAELREAIERIRRVNLSLGEVAVQENLLSGRDAVRVNAQQRHQDRPFGELAVEMGLLTEEQLERVVRLQAERRVYVGEALVQLGYLDAGRLGELLDRFKSDQACYEVGRVELPAWLADCQLAETTIDLVPKLCMRVARLHAKVERGVPLGSPPDYPYASRVMVRGEESLEICLFGDREFALHIAAGVSGAKPDQVPQVLIHDGMCEFLNTVVGNAVSILERAGVTCDFSPAEGRAAPRTGYRFDLLASAGLATLVLAKA